MRTRRLDDEGTGLFRRHSPGVPLSACIGLTDTDGEPLRLVFHERPRANVMIVGRSREAALGICLAMLLDLATQISTIPDRRARYTTPPFSILDFSGTHESRIFTDTAMSLPLPIKLERATDTAMNALTDFQFELTQRQRGTAVRQPKFLFLCGLQAAHGIRSRGSYASPEINPQAVKFTRILRDGAFRSLYSIIWCNSFANIDLTMPDGLGCFDHIIILDGAGRAADALEGIPAGPADHAWYVDRTRNLIVPFIPLAVPSESWCEAVVRSFN